MINNELRLGNYLNYWKQNESVKITGVLMSGLYADGYCYGKGVLAIFQFKPIPLTEEWLIKFGFCDENNVFMNIHKTHDNLNNINFEWNNEDSSVYITDDDGEILSFVETKYVHQFQNLYFSLIGNDFTLIENK